MGYESEEVGGCGTTVGGVAGSRWRSTMIVFWGAVVFLVVWLVRGRASEQAGSGSERPSALEILDERFARGEINREEYEARRSVLSSR